jgi:hypothetical protein
MKYNKKKNGYKITVAAWDNKIVITNAATGEHVKTETFTDHIRAVQVAKML